MTDPTLKMKSDDRINVEENWSKFTELLLETNREGVPHFLGLLDKTDFKEAPASHKFHMSVKGGLCQHSLNTYKYIHELNKLLELNLPSDTLTVSSLLHDLCKINFYTIVEEWDKEYKDKTNQWRKREVYGIDDKLPLGHGEKSIAIALGYGIKMLPDELLAIRWHMSAFDYASASRAFRQSYELPLTKLLSLADELSVVHEDFVWKKDEKQH